MPIEGWLMSEMSATVPKGKSPRSGSTDKYVFAQVEKWMAIIREVAREQPKS
jgi:hypothetical protein